LSRWSIPEIKREAIERGLVASIGDTTVWRWLTEDAIRPWAHRTWIFPRAPDFEGRAGRVLDLYEGIWEGKPLAPRDCILSTDEKTSIQARKRVHATLPPAPGRPMRVEHEYERAGAWAYFAAWDVRRARIHGRCERTTGIDGFLRLVDQVMRQKPTARHGESSGSWTMARHTGETAPTHGYGRAGPTSSPSTHRSKPVG
jgi:hypothetical protein